MVANLVKSYLFPADTSPIGRVPRIGAKLPLDKGCCRGEGGADGEGLRGREGFEKAAGRADEEQN